MLELSYIRQVGTFPGFIIGSACCMIHDVKISIQPLVK